MGSISSTTRVEQNDLQRSMTNNKNTKDEGSPANSESPNEDGSIDEPAKPGFFARHGKKLVYANVLMVMTGSVTKPCRIAKS